MLNTQVSGQATCMDKVKRRKWLIAGILTVLIIVAIVLAVTLSKSKDTPIPEVDTYNPYVLDESSIVKKKGLMTGILTAT